MPHVRLIGSDRTRTVLIPAPNGSIPTAPEQETRNGYHQRTTFAVLRDMETLFDTAGISETQYWEMIKIEFNIVSRTELLESEYARIAATLKACQQDPVLFNALVAKVKAHVPVTDASPSHFRRGRRHRQQLFCDPPKPPKPDRHRCFCRRV